MKSLFFLIIILNPLYSNFDQYFFHTSDEDYVLVFNLETKSISDTIHVEFENAYKEIEVLDDKLIIRNSKNIIVFDSLFNKVAEYKSTSKIKDIEIDYPNFYLLDSNKVSKLNIESSKIVWTRNFDKPGHRSIVLNQDVFLYENNEGRFEIIDHKTGTPIALYKNQPLGLLLDVQRIKNKVYLLMYDVLIVLDEDYDYEEIISTNDPGVSTGNSFLFSISKYDFVYISGQLFELKKGRGSNLKTLLNFELPIVNHFLFNNQLLIFTSKGLYSYTFSKGELKKELNDSDSSLIYSEHRLYKGVNYFSNNNTIYSLEKINKKYEKKEVFEFEDLNKEDYKELTEPEFDLAAIYSRVVYPEQMRRAGLQSNTMIRFLVNKEGEIVDHVVLFAYSKFFYDEVIKAIEGVEIKPLTIDGEPKYCWVTVPVKFKFN